MNISKKYWRVLIVVFVALVFGFDLFHAVFLLTPSLSPDPSWIIGDWLINYQGGIVRRGLPGEILLRVSQLFNVNLFVLVVGVEVVLSCILLVNVCRLAMKSHFSALNAAMIFSPAFILFSVLDPNGAFRKEILLFALLSIVCCYLTFSQEKISNRGMILLGAAAVFLVLSHEMLIVYLPYLVCAFMIRENGLGLQTKKVILALIPALIIGVLVVLFARGAQHTVAAICQSVQQYAIPDCLHPDMHVAAITFLGKDLVFAHEFVLVSLGDTGLIAYILSAILAFLPFVFLYLSPKLSGFRENKKAQIGFVLFVLTAVMGSLPFLWVVADYGRIIHIHATCLTLLFLMVVQEQRQLPLHLDTKQIFAWALAGLYVISWRLIHWEASLDSALPVLKWLADLWHL